MTGGMRDIRSMSGQYASYWNAFLFTVYLSIEAMLVETNKIISYFRI